jgi:hypothetical protein
MIDIPGDEELGLEPPGSAFVRFPCGCILEVPDEDERHDVERCLADRCHREEEERADELAYPEDFHPPERATHP